MKVDKSDSSSGSAPEIGLSSLIVSSAGRSATLPLTVTVAVAAPATDTDPDPDRVLTPLALAAPDSQLMSAGRPLRPSPIEWLLSGADVDDECAASRRRVAVSASGAVLPPGASRAAACSAGCAPPDNAAQIWLPLIVFWLHLDALLLLLLSLQSLANYVTLAHR